MSLPICSSDVVFKNRNTASDFFLTLSNVLYCILDRNYDAKCHDQHSNQTIKFNWEYSGVVFSQYSQVTLSGINDFIIKLSVLINTYMMGNETLNQHCFKMQDSSFKNCVLR